jgi:hypothetical protein
MTFLPALLLLIGWVGQTGAQNVRSETSRRMQYSDPTERINQCKADPATKAVIDEILVTQSVTVTAPTWIIPRAQGFGETLFSNTGNRPLNGTASGTLPIPPDSGYTESYQWLANKLPSRYDERNADKYPGLPPDYDPMNPYAGQLPFLWHETEDVSTWGHKKFPAVPVCIAAFVGHAPVDFRSDSPATFLFAKNLEDRGLNNELKRKYMSALTCDKLTFYEAKVDKALDDLLTDIDEGGKPVISSWFDRVITLFLDLHFGAVNHPDYVRQYFVRMFGVISNLNALCDVDQMYSSYCEVQLVKEYIELRVEKIVQEEDKSSLTFWWSKAGIPVVAVIEEAVHNALAFGQWVNTLYLIIAAKIQGHVAIENILQPLVDPPPKLDFFDAYKQASTEDQRIGVAREAFRLLIPNNVWFSALETSSVNDTGKALNDPTRSRSTTALIPILIQAMNDNYNNVTGETTVSNYDTSRYADFDVTQSSCPFLKNKLLTPEDFSVSDIDGETVIPAGHENLIPVFPSPKYCPFGLGYRRCPAELFNILYVEKVLDKLGHLEFEFQGGVILTPTDLARGVSPAVPEFETAIPAGLVRRPDDIYVKYAYTKTTPAPAGTPEMCDGVDDEACSDGYECSCICT